MPAAFVESRRFIPNACMGPNTQPGAGGSLIFVIEMQMRYIMDMLRKMAVQKIGAVECRQDVHDVYNERIDRAHENMVWTHKGMQTYYRNARGRVPVNYPYRNVDLFPGDEPSRSRRLHRRTPPFVERHEEPGNDRAAASGRP